MNLVCAQSAYIIWAWTKQNLSSRFLTKQVSNRSPQLQRLARKLNFTCSKFTYDTFQKRNNKVADQTTWMRRLVCTCVVKKSPKTGLSRGSPYKRPTHVRENLYWGFPTQPVSNQTPQLQRLARKFCM